LGSSAAHNSPPGGILIPTQPKPWFQQEHYSLQRDKTTVGRGSECHVRINHPNVSRNHLELSWRDETLIVSQLSPVNPTLINGVPLSTPRPLRAGDRIELADGVEFRVEFFDRGEDMPTEPRRVNERRMYAILHADVVSYSRLVEKDDAATARQFAACLDIIRRESESVGGRVENVAGDSMLILFTSASSAVASAVGWQQKIRSLNQGLQPERRMEFRVGINSGDVLITPTGSVHGDAVNIAARIQNLASPGGILVSGVVWDQLQGYENLRFQYVRTNELRNLSRVIRIYNLEF